MLNSEEINDFYREKLDEHGATARGVGWKNHDAQQIRFQQLLKIIDSEDSFSINDLGCGTGDLIELLDSRFKGKYTYKGYDGLEEMIAVAKKKFPENPSRQFVTISNYGQMVPGDYCVSSGIFNVRNNITDKEWMRFIIETITAMSDASRKGFAFNALTKYSDREHMREELFYSDPLFLFDYCKKNFSRNVALLHDYGIYDFTILVKKDI